ncbi:MAG: hypothetical protein AB7K09_05310 [Planctomycetota bacterium]
MSAVVYESLLRSIGHPTALTLTSAAFEESLCPHDPPDDTRWPTPSVFVQARLLLSRLPHRQQVICGITAAELTLPLWEEWAASASVGSRVRDVPRQALMHVYRWLSGDAPATDLDAQIRSAEAAAEVAARASAGSEGRPSVLAYVARLAAEAADNAVYAARTSPDDDPMLRADRASQAVAKAARAVTHFQGASGYDYGRVCAIFLTRWWNRCRCRLAVRDVDTAALNWMR